MSSDSSKPPSEQEIINRIASRFLQPAKDVILGIGDDAAVLRLPGQQGENQLVTTDLLVEGVHFSRDYMTMADVGWKALAVNLSDIAAMGGTPTVAFGTLGVPPGAREADIDGLLAAVRLISEAAKVSLAGGDTVAAPVWIIGFTVLGTVAGTGLTRAGASPGEVVWHSGDLGLSRAGLELLQSGPQGGNGNATAWHRRPLPELELGRYLKESGLATACIDLSDSLSQCVLQLAGASGVGVALDFSEYEFHPEVLSAANRISGGQPALADYLLQSAEDYRLLFTAPASATERLLAGSPARLTRLGTTTAPGTPSVFRDETGRELALEAAGFTHF